MAVLPEFNGDQILLLQTIFNIFHTKGKWPTYDDLDRIITQKYPNFNLEAVSKRMPDGFAAGFGFQRQYDQEAFFIVPALHYCQRAEEEIADFIRVVRLCVERHDRYYSFGEETPEKDGLEFSSELLSSWLHMEPLAIRKMGLLLCHEYDIAFGFSSDIEYNSWHFPLKRGTDGVGRFRGVETFEQYIEKRSSLVSPYYTGGYPLGLTQDKPISDMTVMGLRRASTQVHLQGDQYDSSDNLGNIDTKSSLTWDYLINELQRLNSVAIKIQRYENGTAKLGLSMDEYGQFFDDYLNWYSDCLVVLPDDMKDKFRAEYEKKAYYFITKAHFKTPIEEGFANETFLYPHGDWFYPAFVNHKLMLLEASKRQPKILTASSVKTEPMMENEAFLAEQLRRLLGYMYRKAPEGREKDIEAGIETWTRNLTVSQEAGEKLEVALLNALSRLGIPSFFAGSASSGGPETPVFDLAALGFFAARPPTAILISCKSSKNQPNLGEIGKLSDEAVKVRSLLSGWLVFGTLVVLGEPTAQEFNYRQDIRIWKQSHVQAILRASTREQIDSLIWTPPQHWHPDTESIWRSQYKPTPEG